MSDETINLQEWVEAIQDVASLEQDLRETSNPQKQQILFRARREAVERVLAIRYLTGATTDRIDTILETEPWANAFYDELSKEKQDDMGFANSQCDINQRQVVDARSVPTWYGGCSPIGKTHTGQ